MESLKQNKILISVFILVLLGCAYFFFFRGSSSPADVSSAQSAPSVGQPIMDVLAEMNAIKIDTTLFTGAAWMSLRDNSSPVSAEAPGKKNLFAPLGR